MHLASLDALGAGCFQRLAPGDAGQDAAVERGGLDRTVADAEDARARDLEHCSVAVEEQRQLAGRQSGLRAFEQSAVGPLVGAETTFDRDAGQVGGALRSGEDRRRVDLCNGDLDLEPVVAVGGQVDAQFPVLDAGCVLEHDFGSADRRWPAVELGDAVRQPPQVGRELDRASVEDQHRLEDAFARIGSEAAAHRGYLDAMPVASQPGAQAAAARPRPLVERLDFLADAERAFVHIYGAASTAFWLDGGVAGERGRFSFMGDASGPLAAVVTYALAERRVRLEGRGGVELREESIFDYLDGELARLGGAGADLPFGFRCGLVGYLGYELKAECDGAAAHRAAGPDAALIRADRMIAFDHHERHTYLLALVPTPPELHQIPTPAGREFDAVREAEGWIAGTARRLEALPALRAAAPPAAGELRLRRSPGRYREDVEACKGYLRAGHSYEICLTNRAVAAGAPDPLALYLALRRVNPAPYSAFLRFGDLAVLSSSPERFLEVDGDGWAESRPIKGTSPRGATSAEDARLAAVLAADPKNRAENVTIVDLVRNDLGRVCEVGSVEVAELMRVESYETVHQLVSAVRGRLRSGVTTGDAIRACFPPGSMTGAPKRRTMEILDELEGEARGVYSGAIGWLGPGGACDLSVAIRTVVIDGQALSIGAGGAIVADSDPEQELAEMLLKAAAPAAALGPGASISFGPAAAPGDFRRRPLSPRPTS